MRYDTVVLDTTREEARDRIAERVPDVRVRTTDDAVRFTTNAGILLAELTDAELPTGGRGSKLRYRTVMVQPTLSHARTQAREIRSAVDAFRVI